MGTRCLRSCFKIIKKYCWEIVVFLLLFYQILGNTYLFSRNVTSIIFPFYLLDFKIGIVSRALMGSLIGIFTDSPSIEQVSTFVNICYIFMAVLTAFAFGRVAKKASFEHQNLLMAVVGYAFLGSFTFNVMSFMFGIPDCCIYTTALLCLICLKNKYLRWLIPLLTVSGGFIHYVYFSSYFPLVALLLFYMAVKEKEDKSYTFLFIITLIVGAATFLYCVLFANNTLTVDLDGFVTYISEKSGYKFEFGDISNYDYYLFGNVRDETLTLYENLSMTELLPKIPFIIHKYLRRGNEVFIITALFALPVFASFILLWIKCIKNSEKLFQKLVYACFILVNLSVIVNCIFSTDIIRWVSAGIIVQLGLLLYLLYLSDASLTESLNGIYPFFEGKGWLVIIAIAVNATSYTSIVQ